MNHPLKLNRPPVKEGCKATGPLAFIGVLA
jgi:hypothetical protein